jgi:hypothetical protein
MKVPCAVYKESNQPTVHTLMYLFSNQNTRTLGRIDAVAMPELSRVGVRKQRNGRFLYRSGCVRCDRNRRTSVPEALEMFRSSSVTRSEVLQQGL